jgi:putative ubiquitin-RnfH superfamily antitoxin RatB of RatAB toxin-antitoxin module
MNRRDKSRLISAIRYCISAETTLGQMNLEEGLTAEEIIELANILKNIQEQRRKLQMIFKSQ